MPGFGPSHPVIDDDMLVFARALKDQGTPILQIVTKLTIKTGKTPESPPLSHPSATPSRTPTPPAHRPALISPRPKASWQVLGLPWLHPKDRLKILHQSSSQACLGAPPPICAR